MCLDTPALYSVDTGRLVCMCMSREPQRTDSSLEGCQVFIKSLVNQHCSSTGLHLLRKPSVICIVVLQQNTSSVKNAPLCSAVNWKSNIGNHFCRLHNDIMGIGLNLKPGWQSLPTIWVDPNCAKKKKKIGHCPCPPPYLRITDKELALQDTRREKTFRVSVKREACDIFDSLKKQAALYSFCEWRDVRWGWLIWSHTGKQHGWNKPVWIQSLWVWSTPYWRLWGWEQTSSSFFGLSRVSRWLSGLRRQTQAWLPA